jgi:large subunit ribosomal protein L5
MYYITHSFRNLSPVFEDLTYNYSLNYISKFNANPGLYAQFCQKITLNFGFKGIKFEKKQMIIFFLVLELLSNQKCVVTHSRKNLINFKIKKGLVVGCKVTLRNENLAMFLDILLLGLPRSEIFKGFFFKKFLAFQNNFSTQLREFFIFYSLESEVLPIVDNLDLTFKLKSSNYVEKLFFFTHNKLPLNFG